MAPTDPDLGIDAVPLTLRASPMRRAFAVGVLAALGFLLLSMGITEPIGAIWRAALVAGGGLACLCSVILWRSTGGVLVLSGDALRDGDGQVIASLAEMVRVDRGSFAFKPSNGFAVTLHRPAETRWVPGLWWRVGRRLGVGGVLPAAQARLMAERLMVLIEGGTTVMAQDTDGR